MFQTLIRAVACLFLVAANAAGQPVISSELQTGVIPPRDDLAGFAAPAIAMARDQRGTALAWNARDTESDSDRIFVAPIDDSGRFTAAPREIPTFSAQPATIAVAPSIAASPDGEGFLLAWIEIVFAPPSYTRVAAYCWLDSDLNPSAPQMLTATPASDAFPVIARSGPSSWITVDGSLWQVNGDRSLSGPTKPGAIASDMVIYAGHPLIASQWVRTQACGPGCAVPLWWGGYDCTCYVDQFLPSIHLLWLSNTSPVVDELPLPSDAIDETALATDGQYVFVVRFNGTRRGGGAVLASQFDLTTIRDFGRSQTVVGTFATNAGEILTRPQIATDGTHEVIVWCTLNSRGDHDVVGASLDDAGNVTPLSIASSSDDERDPSVIAMSPGRFLVTYEKINSSAERRLAGRFIEFHDRRRAVQ